MEKIYGVILKHKTSGQIKEMWFDSIDGRDRYLYLYSGNSFEIVEFLGEQASFNFDVRDNKS